MFLLVSCSCDLKEYYFNLNKFEQPVYYKFEFENNARSMFYWKLVGDTEAQTLVTDSYDSNKMQVEHFKERYTNNGSNLVGFIFFEDGDSIEAKVISEIVYSWSKEEEYSYLVETSDKKHAVSFSKSREFIGFENIEYMDKTYKAAKFLSNYTYHDLVSNELHSYWQHDFYTKEHGFVKYERHYSNGYQTTVVLTGILSEEEWVR